MHVFNYDIGLPVCIWSEVPLFKNDDNKSQHNVDGCTLLKPKIALFPSESFVRKWYVKLAEFSTKYQLPMPEAISLHFRWSFKDLHGMRKHSLTPHPTERNKRIQIEAKSGQTYFSRHVQRQCKTKHVYQKKRHTPVLQFLLNRKRKLLLDDDESSNAKTRKI